MCKNISNSHASQFWAHATMRLQSVAATFEWISVSNVILNLIQLSPWQLLVSWCSCRPEWVKKSEKREYLKLSTHLPGKQIIFLSFHHPSSYWSKSCHCTDMICMTLWNRIHLKKKNKKKGKEQIHSLICLWLSFSYWFNCSFFFFSTKKKKRNILVAQSVEPEMGKNTSKSI